MISGGGELEVEDLAPLAELIHHAEGGELARLASLVRPDLAIVEIGSFRGASACYLARGSRGAHVHCVDLWDLGGQTFARSGKAARKYSTRSVYADFLDNIERFDVADRVTPHRGASEAIAETWTTEIGLLFVDGLHSYDGVRSDLAAWTPHLAEGAIVAFHDYHPKFPGVIQAADEWAGERRLEIVDRLAWAQI